MRAPAVISTVRGSALGVPFDSLLAIRILQPAGMISTHLDVTDATASLPTYYDVAADGAVSVSASVDNSCKMGGGGFVASAEDIVRFHNAVLDGGLVPIAAVRELLVDIFTPSAFTERGKLDHWFVGRRRTRDSGNETGSESGNGRGPAFHNEGQFWGLAAQKDGEFIDIVG